MPIETDWSDTRPCHPPKRSIKVRLRKEEEKKAKEEARLLNKLKHGHFKR